MEIKTTIIIGSDEIERIVLDYIKNQKLVKEVEEFEFKFKTKSFGYGVGECDELVFDGCQVKVKLN